MTFDFKMDQPQPRLLDSTRQGLIGTDMARPEGLLKVTGAAAYAADHLPEGCVHGMLVRATVTRGRVTAIDEGSIGDIPGLLGVFHGPKFIRNPAQGMAGESPIRPDTEVHFHGQPIALVVAETFEAAREGALRLAVTYESAPAEVDPETASEVESDEPDTRGDWDDAWGKAAARVDLTFRTAGHVSAAMEPHAAVAEWQGENLLLRGALQMVATNRLELADALGVEPERVRVVSPFVGGGFGSKLGIGPEAVAASVAARDLGRPVRVVMARQTVFDAVLRRTETRQRLRLAADADGKLLALAHDDRISNLPGEGFAEPVSSASRFTYDALAMHFAQEVARNHRTPSGSVRAPGEAVGMITLEVAMDMLAQLLDIDPLDLRLKNVATSHPMTGQAFGEQRLADCLTEGARRFGWADRPAPGTRSEGDWLIGAGMAAAARPNALQESSARVRLTPWGAVVETDMTDIGTGTYAILTQIAGEMLGLPAERVEVRLADSDFPRSPGSGGSFGASSSGSAVFMAAKGIREKLARTLGCDPDDLALQDGIARGGNVERSLADLIDGELGETATVGPGKTAETHASAGFGAHFAEVAVHRWTGEIRVRRMLGLFDIGRVLNERTARGQALGGMIWGMGGALHEALEHDPRTGHIANRDLANYHVAAHADVPGDITADFLPVRDDHANPMQSKGVGELGISGSGAAILNAVHDACGARLLSIPATPDKVIAAMEEG
ncbi:xanthine dehydrogenase family protein molybdopterin-binding subunit [Citreimonas salinaria]|uniref:Xanthine dehydrogenase, molybdenum binding subunit apoprotein n=1 Tax=Citreimonas salinaria TaxID=321339 RepID=A0A1H3IUN1_9RHOB|nr:xanthine dehydrogenase family protein molybdopterin-binding subunit [Citreimonas salinaria]SDY31473.1 xanthine dehydrogenase, molybdenum binding subunit apoprotein [Citreimonas salinaria]